MTDAEKAALVKKKQRARKTARRAIQQGLLQRPAICPRCEIDPGVGRDGRTLINAHHYLGYDHPLAVEWLCVTCHCQDDPRCAGERSGTSKLKAHQIIQIRADKRPARKVAPEYGVSRAQIGRIRRGEHWGHVT